MHEHPLINESRRTGNMPATRITDLTRQEEFERTALYNEFYRQLGFASQLAISLPGRPGDAIGLVYTRKDDFTDRERQLLNLVRMHVLHMYRQAKRFDFLVRRLRMAHAMLETLDEGVIALSESLEIQQATARAAEMLRRHFGGKGRIAARRQLPQPLLDWTEQVARTGRVIRGHRFETAAGPLSVRLFRMQHGSTRGWLIKMEEPRKTDPVEELKSLGLTERESEVLFHLAQGKTNAAIARELHSSHRTVEKHVEHILNKLKVTSRGAAAAVANRSLGAR